MYNGSGTTLYKKCRSVAIDMRAKAYRCVCMCRKIQFSSDKYRFNGKKKECQVATN